MPGRVSGRADEPTPAAPWRQRLRPAAAVLVFVEAVPAAVAVVVVLVQALGGGGPGGVLQSLLLAAMFALLALGLLLVARALRRDRGHVRGAAVTWQLVMVFVGATAIWPAHRVVGALVVLLGAVTGAAVVLAPPPGGGPAGHEPTR